MTKKEILKQAKLYEDEIIKLRAKIELLKNKYMELVAPCNNKECNKFNKVFPMNCFLTDWVTDCADYIPEYE